MNSIKLKEPYLPSSDVPGDRTWLSAILPLTLLIVSLFAVIFILAYTGNRVRSLRKQIVEVADSAGTNLYDLQRILALQMSAQRGYRLGSDPRALEDYRRYKAEGRAAFERLSPLIRQLGPDAAEDFAELRVRSQRWQTEVEQFPRESTQQLLNDRLSTQNGVYAAALAAGDRLERAIQNATDAKGERIREMEQVEIQLVVLLTALALGSVLLLVRVGHELRKLTVQAHSLVVRAGQRQEAMERLAQEKASFIRGVTHDLKNPLGAIDAYAQLLEAGIKGEMTPDQSYMIQRIRHATQETLGIIQDLLELARVEASQMRIERIPTDPAALIAGTVENYHAALDAQGLSLAMDPLEGLPTVLTDEARVKEILGNMISNAAKYTPTGGTVGVHAAESETGPLAPAASLAVSVSDTGPGIAPDEQEKVFDEFHRVKGSGAAGMGLGLAIGRRMARLLGGELTVQSKVGEGSTFTLWLPLVTAADGAVAHPQPVAADS